MPADDRVMVYIDGSNLYHSLSVNIGRADLDFLAFARKLVGDRRLQRIYYYNAPVDQGREPEAYRRQRTFFYNLQRVNYLELRLGRLIYPEYANARPYEKGIDIKLATDMLVHGTNGNYDAAVLVSGDTDFYDALQAVKNAGRHVEVGLFDPQSSSRVLRDVADRVVRIDREFLSDCWLR